MNALVSVIIPVYNTAGYMARCLDTVCGQTYTDLEIICVDDGSTDNSAEILAEYAAKYADDLFAAVKNAGLHITMPVFCYSSSCRSGRKRDAG